MFNTANSVDTQEFDPNAFAIPLNETPEQLSQIQKAATTVTNCTKILETIQSGIERSLSTAGGNDQALNLCRGFVDRGFHAVKTVIDGYATINGTISTLNEQSERFKTLFEKLVTAASTAKNLSTPETIDTFKLDLAELKKLVEKANKDFDVIESLALSGLAKLGPRIRETDPTANESYRAIVNHYSTISLFQNQLETHLWALTTRVDLLNPGKLLADKLNEAAKELSDFEAAPENTEVKGLAQYRYIRKEKEESIKELVQKSELKFAELTSEAKEYKVQLHEVFARKLPLVSEKFADYSSFGDKEQFKINAKKFPEGNNTLVNLHAGLATDITAIWAKIHEAQKQLSTKIEQAKNAIQKKTEDETSEMYYNSTLWTEKKGLLNADARVKEEEVVVLEATELK